MKPGSKVLAIVLLFVGLILLNYLAGSIPARIDATAGHIYTLSPGTRALLGKVEEPVELDFYFSRSAGTLPIALKNYADRVLEMLGQYVRAAHGKVVLNVIDPKPDTAEEDKATAAGISPQTWPATGEQFYFGLVAIQADHQKVIPALTTDREQFLEYDLSQLLYDVQLVDRRKLGLLTSLPLRGQMDYAAMQSGQMPQSQYVIREWQKTYDLVTVDPSADALPDDLDVLAVIHPENLSPKLQFAIDQFLLSGKPVFMAVDPSSRYFRAQGGQMSMMGGPQPNVSSDAPDLFKGWGITYDPQSVVGDPAEALSVQASPGNVVQIPIWLSLEKGAFNGTMLPTSDLENLWFIEPGSFTVKAGPDLKVTPLIQSSPASGTVPAALLGMTQPDQIGRQLQPSGSKILAALIQGKFQSAFPAGPPAEKPAAETKPGDNKPATPPAPKVPGLKMSKVSSTLLLVADTDWLFDDYSVRKMNFLGVDAAEPMNDNLAFASNALDFLAGSPELISIRGKGVSLRPFQVVHAMEVAAQQKYQEKLDALEKNLDQVQSQLTALEGKKTEGGRLVASPDLAKSIENLRTQQVKFRAERRDIRKTLREGIEALENRLLMVNLLSTPLLVGCFGAWFYWRRRRQ
ncbi:MAG TPA: Gldg family protein [Opitutaceae bacterium]|nr:Gldg family protein [Opitutaceae bacterium]